jgi:hypothetical protein
MPTIFNAVRFVIEVSQQSVCSFYIFHQKYVIVPEFKQSSLPVHVQGEVVAIREILDEV